MAKNDPNHPYGGWPKRWNLLGVRGKNPQINDAAWNEKHKYDIQCKLFNSVNAVSAELRLVAEQTLKTN